ncbi:hypothetical protein EST38_g9882 [Candolleomyces aberdarensis]|uniref:Uncharacterized protein n=1 Tax=Candolleomyces aberdarensis TaxID=2316362 RepID=A0A4Q2D8U5_9AGAR|nr:hypothetical protein EST38_g9882 [Candolleomyces aberdarensis]
MASSYQDTALIEPRKETLKTGPKAISTAADTKADNGNAVVEPKPTIVQLDGDEKADTGIEEDEDPTYSDDEELPDFEGGQPRGILNKLGYKGPPTTPRPKRPV